jgi:hypothetical protein
MYQNQDRQCNPLLTDLKPKSSAFLLAGSDNHQAADSDKALLYKGCSCK